MEDKEMNKDAQKIETLPCHCCDCKDCGGFQKLLESKRGLTIYRDTSHMVDNDVLDHPGGRVTQQDDVIAITLHNTRDVNLKLADFVDEFDLNKVSCPRCQHVMTRARLILETLSVVDKNEVKCVCDSCIKSIQQKSRAPCLHCQRTMKRFESLGLDTKTRKEDILKKQLMTILEDKKTKVEISGIEKKLKTYSDVDITKAYESSKYYDPCLDVPRTSQAVDSKICECDKKLARLLQKKIEPKKVKIRDVPETVRSLQDFELKDFYSTDDIGSVPPKPILKPAIETYFTPPQVVKSPGRVQKSPYRSGLLSGTVWDIGTTGVRRTRSDESLITSYLGITDEMLLKSFKYIFPRVIKKEKTVTKTSAELIKETQARLQEAAKEKIQEELEELQRKKQEKKLKKLVEIGDNQIIEEWAKREGINISDIDTKTGKIKGKEKKEAEAQETGAIYHKTKKEEELQKKNKEKELQKFISLGDEKNIQEWAKKEGINILDIDTKTGKIRQREKKEDKIQEELQRKKQAKELKKLVKFGDNKKIEEWAKKKGIPILDIDTKTGKIRQREKKEDKTQKELQRKKQEKELKKIVEIGDNKKIAEWAKKKGIPVSDIDTKTGKIIKREKKEDKIQEKPQIKKQEKELKRLLAEDFKSIEKWAAREGINMSDIDLKTGKIRSKKQKKIEPRETEPRETVTAKQKREKFVKEQRVKKLDTVKKKEGIEGHGAEKKKEGKEGHWGAKHEREHKERKGKENTKKEKQDETGTEKIKKEKRERSITDSKTIQDSDKKKMKVIKEETKNAVTKSNKAEAIKEKNEKRVEPKATGGKGHDPTAFLRKLDKPKATGGKGLDPALLRELDKLNFKPKEPKAEEKGTQTPRSVASGPDKKAKSPKSPDTDKKESERRPYKSNSELLDVKEKEIIIDTNRLKKVVSEETLGQIELVKTVIGKHEKAKVEGTKLRKAQRDKLASAKNKAEQATKRVHKKSLLYLDVKGKKKKEEEEKQKQLENQEDDKKEKKVQSSKKQIQIEVSGDDLILQLVKMKIPGSRHKPPSTPKNILPSKVIRTSRKVETVRSDSCQSDKELDKESLLRKRLMKAKKEDNELIFGQKIYLRSDIPPEQPEIQPALFRSEFNDRVPYVKTTNYESEIINPVPERDGVFKYALSDRKFIENGWTLLPTEKIVRKMNVYRMRPSHPEYDWFEHNKYKGVLQYESGEKLAEVTPNGRGRWYYKNGRIALEYYDCAEMNAQQRFMIYSSGEPDERGRSRGVTILGMFDYLGNGIIFDHNGKIRLKYNQSEGVVLDRKLGPVTHWLWHSLNEPPELQQVMIDTRLHYKDPALFFLETNDETYFPRHEDEAMLAIEFDNYIKSSNDKPTKEFKPYQIRMKALKINEQFSLKIIDQETIVLSFREGSTTMKLNLGMILDHKELLDTNTSELNEVSLSFEKRPAASQSVDFLQNCLKNVQNTNRTREERELKLRPRSPAASVDQMNAAASKPTHPLLISDPTSTLKTKCKTLPSANNLYYNTRLI